MIKTAFQNSSLSNNDNQIFKSDKVLSLNNINIISRLSDGYINLTQLCQAGKKNYFHWKENKKTKAFLEVLSASIGIPMDKLIKYNTGSNSERANWGHPQVAINIAQWISPEFDVQVSKWVFELMVTGKVELGKEKSNEELNDKYLKLSQDHSKLLENHNRLLKRRNRVDYETGNVIYIISHEAFTMCYNTDYYKFGKSTQKKDESKACFKDRLSTYNTGAPVNYKVHYLLYVDNNALIEETIKEKFNKQLDPSNKEWIKGISLETIISFIQSLMELMNVPCKKVMLDPVVRCTNQPLIELVELVDDSDSEEIVYEESEEEEEDEKEPELSEPDYSKILAEIDKYTDRKLREVLKENNLSQSGLKEVKKDRLKNHILKGGISICEKCSGNKELNELNFRRTQIGFVKVCLECEKKECKKTVLYRKDVHTTITHGAKTKVCTGCKIEKVYDDFHKNKANRDGLVSRCKNCESNRKSGTVRVALKKKVPKVDTGYKWCPKCEKTKENVNFRRALSRPDGLQHSCKECENETRRRNRKINKINN